MRKTRKILLVAFAALMVAAGCGGSEETLDEKSTVTSTPVPTEASVVEQVEVSEKEEITPTSTPTPTPTEVPVAEEQAEEIVEEKFFQITNSAKTIFKIDSFSPYTRDEEIKMQRVSVPYNNPYFVGRENYEENINFIEKNMGEEDGYLYLGLPMYLPDYCPRGTVFVAVDNEEVAKIEGNDLIGLKQGICNLSCYDENKELLLEKKIVCSTYNDSKKNLESLMSITTGKYSDMKAHWNMNDINYWRDNVHTMMDMSYMLQARNFIYSFDKEPKLGYIENAGDEYAWTWTADASTIFDMNGGVCIQVAQLACYMLAGDYEDWGVVMVEGQQGHIFNWFFEDGYYYIFDFTEVISDNAWNKSERKFWDYSNKVKMFQTIEEIKEYIVNEKVEIDKNYLVYMYSCLGHEFIACNLNTGMSDSYGVTEGKYEKVTIGYQDVVMKNLEVLYKNPNSSDIEWITYNVNELIELIQHGVYNDNDVLQYRYKY